MRKRGTTLRIVLCLGVSLALLATLLGVCRRYGIPLRLLGSSETHDLSNPVYRVVGQVFGYSGVNRTRDGKIRYWAHTKFPANVMSLSQRDVEQGRMHLLVDADYYDTAGERISTIRNGNGIEVLLSDSDRPCLVVSYLGGIPSGVCIHTYGSGKLRLLRYYDRNGLPDGPIAGYYENGARRFEGTFEHGVPTGAWRAWSEDGQEDPRPDDHPAIKAFRHR